MALLPDDSVPESHRRYAPGRELVAQPVRHSLLVSELTQLLAPERIEPGRLTEAMARLEAQLRLRERDAAEFTAWEAIIRSIGTADAQAELDQVRTGFIDVITSPTALDSSSDLQPLTSVAGFRDRWGFAGNRPAMNPDAVTPRALASAELDTRIIDVVSANADIREPTLRDRPVGETGWMVHDAVLGNGHEPRVAAIRRLPVSKVRGWMARLWATRRPR